MGFIKHFQKRVVAIDLKKIDMLNQPEQFRPSYLVGSTTDLPATNYSAKEAP